MFRFAPALLVLALLALAVPAHALPVTYMFASTTLGSGAFSFDGDTGLGTLSLSVPTYWGGVPVNVTVPALFGDTLDNDGLTIRTGLVDVSLGLVIKVSAELNIIGPDLFIGGQLRTDLTHGLGSVETTALIEDVVLTDDSYTQSSHLDYIQHVPEPVLGALIALGLLASAFVETRLRF